MAMWAIHKLKKDDSCIVLLYLLLCRKKLFAKAFICIQNQQNPRLYLGLILEGRNKKREYDSWHLLWLTVFCSLRSEPHLACSLSFFGLIPLACAPDVYT